VTDAVPRSGPERGGSYPPTAFRLPRGATGFRHAGDPPPSAPDPREFTRIVHDVARRMNGRVLAVDPAGGRRSFHAAMLTYRDRELELVGHVLLPLLALARLRSGSDMTLSFLDDPEVSGKLGAYEPYRVPCTAELTLPVARADLSELGEVEMDQIHYWRPETVGELVFNFWD
jgi:hypothetical protein